MSRILRFFPPYILTVYFPSCKGHLMCKFQLIYLTLFIISIVLPISPDDSIQSTPYWDCNINGKPDTTIVKVVQRKDEHSRKSYVQVYYKINQFRKSTIYNSKIYK
jgi:hypothetical protein